MVVYGFATAHMVLTPEILIQLYGADNLNTLVSIFNFTSKGPGILIGTTSGGFIYENYDHKTVCIISGVVFIVSCVTCFFSKLWWENHENKEKKENLKSENNSSNNSSLNDLNSLNSLNNLSDLNDLYRLISSKNL